MGLLDSIKGLFGKKSPGTSSGGEAQNTDMPTPQQAPTGGQPAAPSEPASGQPTTSPNQS